MRPQAPASAGATEEEELGIICLVHTTGPAFDAGSARPRGMKVASHMLLDLIG